MTVTSSKTRPGRQEARAGGTTGTVARTDDERAPERALVDARRTWADPGPALQATT